ncbi:MAG TPA: hypothetical protein VHC94_10265 [Nitrobacter sp.]|nr:hypothetical protein [Nitrobacter sp.]
MRYKTVMVSLALDRPNTACLTIAGDLAERFGAHVIGIAVSDIRPALYFAEGEYAKKFLDEESGAIRKRLSELEVEFRAAVSKRAKSVEWRSALALPIPYVTQQARAADILVVNARPEAAVDPYVAADPEADPTISVAEQLDRIGANVGAGVMIAGAYGHSRLREWILGGVTRHLVTNPSRCAFLSR